MTPDSQLSQVLTTFEAFGFEAWLDAGSLLGVVRDGALLPWDKDIDFGCWEEQLSALQHASRTLAREGGYSLSTQQYRGAIHKVKLRPSFLQLRKGARTIDVAIFRHHQDVAWCPVDCAQPQPKERFSARWFLEKPFRDAVIRPWRSSPDRQHRRTRFPRLELDVKTWVVPAHFYRNLGQLDAGGHSIRTPSSVEQYLCLRYGNWRQPSTSWDYCVDDGAIVAAAPEEARDGL